MADSPYELLLPSLTSNRMRVLSFEAHERLSHAYTIDVRVVFEEPHRELPHELTGRHAAFVMHLADGKRTFHGLISEVALEGVSPVHAEHHAEYRLKLVPRLWLLTQRLRSRVFQNKTIQEVVHHVLGEARIPALWNLESTLPRREYITQYEETDEAFVRRLLAEAGIFFFFLQPPVPPEVAHAVLAVADVALDLIGSAAGAQIPATTGEVMVLSDAALGYRGMGDLPPELEQMLRSGLGAFNRATDGAVGVAGEVANVAAPIIGALGGPDLRSLMSLGNSRTLSFRPVGDAIGGTDTDVVWSFRVSQSVRADHASFRTYDPRRPLAELAVHEPKNLLQRVGGSEEAAHGLGVAGAAVSAVGGLVGGELGALGRTLGETLGAHENEQYEHHDGFILPDWEYAEGEAKRILQARRRDHQVADGTSPCALVACGARFTLDGHPADWVNREYAVVEVHHRGRAHVGHSATSEGPTYENRFRSVPSVVPFVPERPRRRTVQTCLTATVIGPSSEAELSTRGMAEVKVRFHWDREHHGTCWVRTMQAWGGVGWGTQFMPRVGMEVVVGFEGGDPDKPIVMGCVYNGTHPTPFSLPEAQTRSGIRTQSTPGDSGYNELSFEDKREEEQIYLHAERDLDVVVEHDRLLHVMNDDDMRIDHDQDVTVTGQQRVRIHGGQHVAVITDRRIEVDGTHEMVTRGDFDESVTGQARFAVRGALHREIGGGSREHITGDAMRRVAGNQTELVGTPAQPRSRSLRVEGTNLSSSGGKTEITSDEELVLSVGQSSIRITEDRIQLSSPEILLGADDATARLSSSAITLLTGGTLAGIADTIVMKSNGAALGLSSEASLDGSRVLLNSPENADDSVDSETPDPMRLELTDQDGNPMAHERYVIELEDGSTVTGVLDENGRASVLLDGPGEVSFPDLPEVDPA